jgi:hypothetical protein
LARPSAGREKRGRRQAPPDFDALAEAYGHDDVAQILDEWLDDRPGDT